jgi:Integrase core domain
METNFMDKNKRDLAIKSAYLDLGKDNPAAFSSVENVYRQAKKSHKSTSRKDVAEYLKGEPTYTLHRPGRIRYKRLAIIPSGLNSHWQADLADFQKVERHNLWNKYLLVCVDVLSRKIYGVPVKSKRPTDMQAALVSIFKKAVARPLFLSSDMGLEFQAKSTLAFFKGLDIQKQTIKAPGIHAGVVERAIKTIKGRLYKYFTQNNTDKWINIVDTIIDNINNSINRTIGVTPNSVNHKNAQELYERVYKPQLNPDPEKKLQVGDFVRLNKDKGKFGKGYLKNYTDEIFVIAQVKASRPVHYKLVDLEGEDILGVFYIEELSPTNLQPNSRISEIIKERKNPKTGRREYLVKWIGESKQEWIEADNKRFETV